MNIYRNSLYIFEALGTVYKRLQKLTSFNNTVVNNKFKKL